MRGNPVGWFEIYVQDMARAKAFYEEVFQVTLSPLRNPDTKEPTDMEMWAFPMVDETYGTSGSLVRMEGCAPGGSPMIYFFCEDCAVEAARAAACGGAIVHEKTSIGQYGYIAVVTDTEGNMIGLHSMK